MFSRSKRGISCTLKFWKPTSDKYDLLTNAWNRRQLSQKFSFSLPHSPSQDSLTHNHISLVCRVPLVPSRLQLLHMPVTARLSLTGAELHSIMHFGSTPADIPKRSDRPFRNILFVRRFGEPPSRLWRWPVFMTAAERRPQLLSWSRSWITQKKRERKPCHRNAQR